MRKYQQLLLITLILLVIFTPFSFANDLILSDKLVLKYQTPKLITHTQNSLIIKYPDWWFAHEILDAQRMYPGIDLSDNLYNFINAIFDESFRSKLPENLVNLSIEQAQAFGVTPDNVTKKHINEASIISVYDEKQNRGDIYIFEERMIHHIDTSCTNSTFKSIIDSIKAR